MVTRDKIRGMIIGGAIGDAYGMPVETWTPQKIVQHYPEGLDCYKYPTFHKWFDPEKTPAGSTTDDTQLTLATIEGMLACKPKEKDFSKFMDEFAKTHVKAYNASTLGWGKSTTEAVRRLCNGVHWSQSGKTTEKHRGTGNGIVMKCSPLALLLERGTIRKFNQALVTFSSMTHNSDLSAIATVAHTHAVNYCFWDMEPNSFRDGFVRHVTDHVRHWLYNPNGAYGFHIDQLDENQDNILTRLDLLSDAPYDVEELRNMFGGGSCYVYDSLPFSYALFLRDPFAVATLQTVVEAGGDTDTNAKMVGEMIGINCGYESFLSKDYRWMIDGLLNHDQLLDLSDKFYDWVVS